MSPDLAAQGHAMSRQHSITSTESFRQQLLRAERWRLAILLACFVVILATIVARRAFGGGVMQENDVFLPEVLVFVIGIALVCFGLIDASRRLARGQPMPRWRVNLGLSIDLGVPYAVLLILHFNSASDPFVTLSPPALLIVPIVIMLSVLRLRPLFSLTTGVIAAIAYWVLVYDTLRRGGVTHTMLPMLASYGLLLLCAGAAASLVSHFVRRYIQGATEEALTAERQARALKEIERDLDIAQEIQRGLLPSEPPEHPAFDIAAIARSATKAGGDYYDWQPLPNGQLVVAIADVTGHGIGPALVMAVCRAYARATAPTSTGPDELLKRLNSLIVDDVKGQRFVTMAVAVLNPDGAIDLVSAGHGPTFLYRAATGAVETFGGDALPLGIMHEEDFGPINRLALDKGDVLVLLTDGYLERFNSKNEKYGMERLTRLVAQNSARTADDIVHAIDRAVESFASGAPQGDDMTLVVIQRR